MRSDTAGLIQTEDQRKNRAFNSLRTEFSRQMHSRFHEVKANIEDIWDLVENKVALEDRLRILAAKPEYTTNNLKDMALIGCILWNGLEDPEPAPE
jgi:hypothetical protein